MSDKANLSFIFVLPILLIITALFLQPFGETIIGLKKILLSTGILFSDFVEIGGISAALLNSGLCGLISCLLILFLKVYVTGPFIAVVFTVIGFAFFGKNILNIWPIIFGVFAFSIYHNVSLKKYLLIALFGTTLSPLVSFIALGAGFGKIEGLILAVLFGLIIGFILPALSGHMLKFHDGYNLYNVGFTGGLIGSFIAAILRSFNIDIGQNMILGKEYDIFFKIFFIVFFVFLLIFGLIFSIKDLDELKHSMKKIFASTGRLFSDFTLIGNFQSTIFNMGLMGLLASLFVIFMGGNMNGPIVGGILTVVGFSAFGKHPLNSIPILIGVFLASLIKIWDTNDSVVVIAGLFGTTLAPITGHYGFFAGIIAGFLHLSVVMNVGILHGGINLYNNGFAGGFVAACLVPIFYSLKRNKD